MPSFIQIRKELRDWQREFDAKAPKEGDDAPDFELSDAQGKSRIQLSSFRGKKPVALIFGSYT
jgi:peroxiredoxin